jgi:division protein CdvB (Snf7/Vps24/ESCRT-III family)
MQVVFLEVVNLSERFSKKWETRREEQPFTSKLKEAVRPPGPLKPRLDFAVRRIELQVQKLDQATERFGQRDKTIFARIVDAYTKHDTSRANVFANELAEIRKMEKLIINARLALEQIVLRLRTVSELGDVVSTLGPAVSVLRSVRTGLVSVFPEAENELGEIGNMLSGIMIEAGQSQGMTLSFDTVNEDATKILTEASTVAEQRIKEKFPDLPPGIPGLPAAPIGEKSSTETS